MNIMHPKIRVPVSSLGEGEVFEHSEELWQRAPVDGEDTSVRLPINRVHDGKRDSLGKNVDVVPIKGVYVVNFDVTKYKFGE